MPVTDGALVAILTSSTHVNQLAHDQDARLAAGCQQSPRSCSKVPVRAGSRDLHSRRTRVSMYVQKVHKRSQLCALGLQRLGVRYELPCPPTPWVHVGLQRFTTVMQGGELCGNAGI